MVKVVRPDRIEVVDNHPSELNIDLIEPDFQLSNNGSLAELEEQVQGLVSQLFR